MHHIFARTLSSELFGRQSRFPSALNIIDDLQEFDVSAWEAKDANIHIDSRGAILKSGHLGVQLRL